MKQKDMEALVSAHGPALEILGGQKVAARKIKELGFWTLCKAYVWGRLGTLKFILGLLIIIIPEVKDERQGH